MAHISVPHPCPSERTFSAIRDIDINSLSKLTSNELRCLLPSLMRMAWCSPLDASQEWNEKRKCIRQIISGFETVNQMVTLLTSDFHALEMDVKREQQLKSKLGAQQSESVLVSALTDGLALEFERSDGIRRLRLFLSELISIMAYVRNLHMNNNNNGSSSFLPTGLRSSELFDNDVYLDDVSDVLCIAIAELPNTLPILEIVETLLHVKNGPTLICRLVANFPESFHEVCLTLLNNGEKQDEESCSGRIRMKVLRLLCNMHSSQSLVIRAEAVELCRMPALTIMLTLDYLKRKNHDEKLVSVADIVSFVTGILLGNDDKIRTWFALYIRIGQKRVDQGCSTSLIDLRNELMNNMNVLMKFMSKSCPGDDCYMIQASVLIQLYCSLRSVASMKFTDEETNALVSLITCHPSASVASVRFVSLGLSMLLACPQLIASAENEKKTINWINWLIEDSSYFGSTGNVGTSFCEMLLLVAIHFHGNQWNAIGELVSSTLGIKIVIRQHNLTRIKAIFTQEIFTDQVVTAHAIRVPVTRNLNANVAGFLPVHCIYQLLKSRAFTKHRVPIKDWIFKQICNSSAPVHPILQSLLEAYVNSVIVPSSKTSHTTNEPIGETEILTIFRHKVYSVDENDITKQEYMQTDQDIPSCALTSQLLLLYYVLLYEDIRLTNMKTILMSDRKIVKYSSEFLAQLPIFYLLQEARTDQNNYGVVFPPLLRIISTHYPHLCLVPDWILTDKTTFRDNKLEENILVAEERRAFLASFESQSYKPLVSSLEKLLILPRKLLWPLAPQLVSKLPSLLEKSYPKQIPEKLKKVWWKLNTIFPRKLWVMTVNALRPRLYSFMEQDLTWSEIVSDPFHVLRCDERVFRNAALMEITLHILNAFLAASRSYFVHHLLERPSKTVEEEKDREDLRIAMLTTQESAAIQILLECCMEREEDVKEKEGGKNDNLKQVQDLIFSHLHQAFISEPNLAKLVHFQGYPNELLPLVVAGIPSMHICLDFIPELLSQADASKLAFAMDLCSYLCKQYPIFKSYNVACLCLKVAYTLLTMIPSERRSSFFNTVIPALVRMCDPIPPLIDDTLKLLVQVSQIHMSYLVSSFPNFIVPEASSKVFFKSMDETQNPKWDELACYFNDLPMEDTFCCTLKKSFDQLSSYK